MIWSLNTKNTLWLFKTWFYSWCSNTEPGMAKIKDTGNTHVIGEPASINLIQYWLECTAVEPLWKKKYYYYYYTHTPEFLKQIFHFYPQTLFFLNSQRHKSGAES